MSEREIVRSVILIIKCSFEKRDSESNPDPGEIMTTLPEWAHAWKEAFR